MNMKPVTRLVHIRQNPNHQHTLNTYISRKGDQRKMGAIGYNNSCRHLTSSTISTR